VLLPAVLDAVQGGLGTRRRDLSARPHQPLGKPAAGVHRSLPGTERDLRFSIVPRWSFRVLVPTKLVGQPTDVAVAPYDYDQDPFFIIGADRVYAGQPDPADPSHFVIDYDDEDGRHTVDGWLQDADTLKFRFRGVENAE
jgi:hypothetical protein